jgi:hypothetical protein
MRGKRDRRLRVLLAPLLCYNKNVLSGILMSPIRKQSTPSALDNMRGLHAPAEIKLPKLQIMN